jgi:hypothetical protein
VEPVATDVDQAAGRRLPAAVSALTGRLVRGAGQT